MKRTQHAEKIRRPGEEPAPDPPGPGYIFYIFYIFYICYIALLYLSYLLYLLYLYYTPNPSVFRRRMTRVNYYLAHLKRSVSK